MVTTPDIETPRIYVASLSDYNNGQLHGCWIDIDDTTTTDEIQDQIEAMLSASDQAGAEEYAIHDVDNFGGWPVGEYEALETVAAVGAFMATHNPAAVAAWLNNTGTPLDDLHRFEDDYVGTADSERAYTVDYLDAAGWSGLTPEQLAKVWNYLDLDAIQRALFNDGHWSAPDPAGGVLIFRDS